MKITLYKHCFTHDGVKVMSVSLIVWRSDTECTSFGVPGYVKSKEDLFGMAIAARDMAANLKTLLTDLGHDVEMDEDMKSSLKIDKILGEAYGRDLPNAG
jgi:hypothetical protein